MQQILDFPIHHRYDFASFIPCDGNACALEFARKVADSHEPEKLLYLYGQPGCGKTHLINAIAKELGNGCTVLSGSELADTAPETVAKTVEKVPALLLDDLHLLPDRSDLRQIIWEGFNRCYHSGKIIVLTGTLPPKELDNLDDHLISRLLWGLVAQMDISDDRSRLMILAKLASDWQVTLPQEVADYLITVLPRDVGSLVSGFRALYQQALASRRKITHKLARELFNPQNVV